MGDQYVIVRSETFKEKLKKMSKEFERQIEKIEEQLRINPYVGKPLGVKWKREKKIGEKRIYYIIHEDKKSVSLSDISGKKDQQKTIDIIKRFYATLVTFPSITS